MGFEKIILPHLQLRYDANFFSEKDSNHYLISLQSKIPWKQDTIKLFGKEILQPRLSAFYGNPDLSYTYSGLKLNPLEFLPEILEIKEKIEEFSEVTFNSCLANLYRDGNDSMGWHADDEKELGKNPVIASVSFGSQRIFHLKSKEDKNLKYKVDLNHGSLLLMEGETQHYWKHQLPKTKREISPRINLTFRKIQ